MPPFHRKSTKNPPVVLSSHVAEKAEDAGEKAQTQVENAVEQVENQMDQVAENVQNLTKNKKTIPLKTVHHIKSYPLVQQTRSFLRDIPAARILHANTKPLIKSVLESKTMQFALPVTNTVDNVANSSLNLTEKVVPSLKTKTYEKLGEEILLPYNITVKYGKQISHKTLTIADANVYQPAHNQVLKFRKYYNDKFYDTKGKPLIRSSLDPITGPINNFFEMHYVKCYPKGKNVPKEGYSSELNRSFALVFNFFSRALPVWEKNVYETGMIPCHYIIHANKVVNKELDKQPSLGFKDSLNGSKNAAKELEKEATEYIKNNGPFHKKKKLTNVVDQTQDRIQEIQSHV